MYIAVPVLLYAGERTLRFFRSGFYDVRLLKVSIVYLQLLPYEWDYLFICVSNIVMIGKKLNFTLLRPFHMNEIILSIFSNLFKCSYLIYSGCYIYWKRSHITNVKASPVSLQEWPIHVRPMPCCFSIWMVNHYRHPKEFSCEFYKVHKRASVLIALFKNSNVFYQREALFFLLFFIQLMLNAYESLRNAGIRSP